MATLRLSRAKTDYQCDKCARLIRKGREYIRVEPFPIARIRGMEKVKHICKQCVGFQASVEQEISENTKDWLKRQWAQNRQDYRQLSFADLSFNIAQTQVYVFNISSQFIRNLITSPEEMYKLTPVMFEELICERLSAMGFGVQQVGGHTYHKDGGIDVVAWTKLHEFPFLMAIQAKYHHSPMVKTGPQSVRECFLSGRVRLENDQIQPNLPDRPQVYRMAINFGLFSSQPHGTST